MANFNVGIVNLAKSVAGAFHSSSYIPSLIFNVPKQAFLLLLLAII